jgi:hypothetical protein
MRSHDRKRGLTMLGNLLNEMIVDDARALLRD